MENPFVFFVVLGYKDQPVRALSVGFDEQDELTRIFENQRTEFMDNKNQVDFNDTAGYKCDNDDIFVVKNFDIQYKDKYDNYNGLEKFHPSNKRKERIRAIVALDQKTNDLMFQSYYSLITIGAGKHALIFDTNTFNRVNNFVLSVGNSLAALYQEGSLYFRSVQAIQSFINIAESLKEASDNEIIEIFTNNIFYCESTNGLLKNLSSKSRKLFSMLRQSPIINNSMDANQVAEIAGNNGVLIDVTGDEKIEIPYKDKKELEAILNFLTENIFTGPFSNEQFITNSKRKIPQ